LSKTMKVLCEIQPEQPRQSSEPMEVVEEQQENLIASEKMEQVDACVKGTREQLQEKLTLSVTSENTEHVEMTTAKANTLRLERQRERQKMTSIVDVTKLLTKQVHKGIEEAAKLKKKSIDDQRTFKDEVHQLKNELASCKQNQAKASHEILLKSTEHLKEKRKLQKDISRFNHEFKSMRDKFANQEGKIVDLEIKLQQSNRINRDNKETFLTNLKQKNKLIREAERALTSVPSDEEMGGFLEEIKLLKKQINELKAEKTLDSDEHKAMEQAYREEICKIKATVIESEVRCQKVAAEKTFDSDEHKAMEQGYREEICKIRAAVIESEVRCQKVAAEKTFDSDEYKAMEQKYREEICKIKAALIESEVRCQKEASCSKKEQRTLREMEVERVKESERQRLVTEKLSEVESFLQAENAELKQKLEELSRAKTSSIAQPRPECTAHNAPRSPSSTKGEKGMCGPPTKADSLRKKLAQSRERLADIRDASRPLPPAFFSLDQWSSLKGSPWYQLALFQSKGEPQTPTPPESVTSNESLSSASASASLNGDDQFSLNEQEEFQLGSVEEEYVSACAPSLITTERVHVGEEYQMSSGICTINEVFMSNALDGIEVTERQYADI
jgi:DNA repair exonuclease SbcCD ATPase subunit